MELKDIQAGVKYHNFYHTKKQSVTMEEDQVFLEKSWHTKEKKKGFKTHFRFIFMSHASLWYLSCKKGH